jgi:two-component sensor histidine kinase
MAIEQQQSQRKLQSALDRHQLLLKEVNHRVKNSLQVVASMLHLQANAAGNPQLSESLNEAASRISTVGRAYDRLAYAADYEKIDLITYLKEVLKDIERAVSPNVIHFEAPREISILADRAILIGLIINELISNAGKYAYPDRSGGGPIWVTIAQIEKSAVALSVRDEGVGLPADFDLAESKRLGTRLVSALSEQLGAEVTKPASATGTNFSLLVPLEAT